MKHERYCKDDRGFHPFFSLYIRNCEHDYGSRYILPHSIHSDKIISAQNKHQNTVYRIYRLFIYYVEIAAANYNCGNNKYRVIVIRKVMQEIVQERISDLNVFGAIQKICE